MVILITGHSSGIGQALSFKYLKEGHKVYGISHDDYKYDNIFSYKEDITNFSNVEKIVDDIILKEGRIDILINCAGYGISGAVEDTNINSIKHMFDVNYFGAVNISKYVISKMRENNFGKIAFLSSVASILPIPFQAFYSSHKAALNLLSLSLSLEVKDFNIQVIHFTPGDIKTNFTQNRKKNISNNEAYKDRIEKSVKVMEKDEINGMKREYVAHVIYNTLKKKKLPYRRTVGRKYRFFMFLHRILPLRLVMYIMAKIYAF